MTPKQREAYRAIAKKHQEEGKDYVIIEPAAILSLIAQVEALTVQQGYKLVPVEPTPEMYDAAGVSLYGHTRAEAIGWAKEDKFDSQAGRGVAAYAAMLDAAPTIPAIPGTKEGA